MVKGGRWAGSSLLEEDLARHVFDIMTGKCTQRLTINATNRKLHRLAMTTRPKTTRKGPTTAQTALDSRQKNTHTAATLGNSNKRTEAQRYDKATEVKKLDAKRLSLPKTALA